MTFELYTLTCASLGSTGDEGDQTSGLISGDYLAKTTQEGACHSVFGVNLLEDHFLHCVHLSLSKHVSTGIVITLVTLFQGI